MLASVHTSNEQREKRTLGGIEWWRIQKTMFRKRQTPFSLVSRNYTTTNNTKNDYRRRINTSMKKQFKM